ncbi:uncharacterized protein LOC134479104 isoform X5 [Rattus norvegicus]
MRVRRQILPFFQEPRAHLPRFSEAGLSLHARWICEGKWGEKFQAKASSGIRSNEDFLNRKLGGKLCYCSSPEENEGRTGQQEGLLVTLSIPGPEQTSWLTVQSLQNTELTDSMNKAENKPNGRGERNTQETSCVRMCKSVFAPSLCPPRGVPVRSWLGIEPRALRLLGKRPTTEPNPQPPC